MIRIQTVGTTLLIASLVSGLSACGKTIDPEKMENKIREELSAANIASESLDCPEEIVLEKGNEFECKLKLSDGKEITIEAILRDDKGNLTWKARGFIFVEDLEQTIQDHVKKENSLETDVMCSKDSVILLFKDESIECIVKDSKNRKGVVRVTAENDYGEVRVTPGKKEKT